MIARPTPDGENPSASGPLLPQLRARRGSLASTSSTSQVNKEILAEALDHIHSTASQSDALTTFNEYTSPPSSSSGAEDRGITSELQGGLSGLYSRIRASVGNVKDIVTLSAEDSIADHHSTKSPRLALPSPTPSRLLLDPIKSPGLSTNAPSEGRSFSGSRHSSRGGTPGEAPAQDGPRKPRLSKLSSGTTLASQKAHSGSATPLRSPAALNAAAASIASPAVVEVNVNATKESALNTGVANKDGPSEDTVASSKLPSGSCAETNLLLTGGTHRPASLLDRSIYSLETEDTRAFPSKAFGPVSTSDESDSTVPYPTELNESKATKVVESSGSSASNVKLSRKSYPGSPEDTGFEIPSGPSRKKANAQETPRIVAVPGTPQPPATAGLVPSEVEHGLLSVANADSWDQHQELQTSKQVNSRSSSRPRTPDMELPRTTSQLTATSLVHASSHRQHARSSQYLESKTMNAVPPQARSKILDREYWMRDENARDCFYCGDSFSTFRRKHHCRTCGQIFDAKCTTILSGATFGQPGSIRVCRPCESIINGYDDSSDLSDESTVPTSGLRPRHGSTGASDTLGSPIPRSSPSNDNFRRSPMQPDLSVPTMAIPATRKAGNESSRKATVLEIGAERTLARPSSSRSLKSSSFNRPNVSSHRRHHSRHLTQRGFKPVNEDEAPFHQVAGSEKNKQLPAFHDDNIIDPDLAPYLSDEQSSGDEQVSIMAALTGGTGMSRSLDHDKGGLAGFLSSSKKGRSRLGEKSTASMTLASRDADNISLSSSRGNNVPRSSRRRNLSVANSLLLRPSPRAHRATLGYMSTPSYPPDAPEKPEFVSPATPTTGPRMVRSSSMRGAAAPAIELNNASLQHVRKLLRQLLQDSELQNISSWEKALVPILLQATDDVNPDVPNGDDIDVRHYVKIKRIPGGRPGDTSYVSGLVFTKNVALKSMPRSIAHPSILILTFAIEYARHQQHFMSLEPVIRQEREYLQNLVSRIAALRPQLLLVQRNVSGLALDLLEQANIATAYNVKASVLEAVSRCSQTRIISSIDKLAVKPAQAGTCSSFYLKTYVHEGRRKTYMFLSGCTKELGCTIVLRGANEDILAKVKRITDFMVHVVNNLKLETCLMRDEFALIPSTIEIGSLSAGKSVSRKASEAVGAVLNISEATRTLAEGLATPGLTAPGSTIAEVPNSDVSKGEHPSFPRDDQPTGVSADDGNMPEDIPMPTFYTDMVEKHRTKILSASPFVKFTQPYLLMRAREQERRLAYLKRLRDQDCSEEQPEKEGSDPPSFDLITPELVHGSLQNASRKAREALRAVHDTEYDKALHNYRTQSRQWETYIAGSINLFDPYAHQNIAVLYSVVCTVTTVPCAGPDLLALSFYSEHETDAAFEADCTLGQYVEELCFHANNICTVNGCERKMFDHHRQYVHGEAQLNVFVEPYPCRLRGLQDTILMWSRCKICGKETQVLPMSQGTWKYSFGKYLEVSFWSSDLHARAGVCPHDLHRDHLRYFGFQNVAVRIHYDPITLLEIIVPRARVTWKVDNDLRFKNDLFCRTKDRIDKYMISVKARVKSIKVETVIPEKAHECQQEIERLTNQAGSDHEALIQKLHDKYMDSKFYEIIPLNRAIRFTQEKVAEWDKVFVDFDRNFFPSEKDIRRLATIQLRKIFLERNESHAPLISSDGTTTPVPEVILEKVSKDGVPALAPQTRIMSPEKAHDMLTAVVEKDGSLDFPEKSPLDQQESAPAISSPNPETEDVHTSLEDLTRLKNEDVRHLDLAVSSKLLESLDEQHPSVNVEAEMPEKTDIQTAGELIVGKAKEDPSVLQPTDIKQVVDRTSKDFAPAETKPSSAIPRPVEGHARRTGPAISSPLLRAQSTPVHLRQDKSSNSSQDTLSQPQSSASNNLSKRLGERVPSPSAAGVISKPPDKRLSDRLGLGVLKPAGVSAHSMIPRSIANTRGQSSVSNLAKHFEQLSREFEKERIKERRQRTATNRQSRAYPMAVSRPIIEIYRNVHEAVEEREPSDEELISSDPSHHEQEYSPTTAAHLAANMESETRGEGFHAEDTTAETTETDDNNNLDSHVGSDVEAEGDRTGDAPSLFDDLPTGIAADHHALTPTEAQLDLKLDLPKHEKTSLMKMLTNFWAERSASGWQALEYPLNATDHIFADSDIIIREDEPSSLIAFALGSEDYQAKLRKISESDHGLSSQDELVDSKESFLGSDEPVEVERSLNRSTGTHFKFQFQEGSAKMLCKVFFAEQFDALRRKCGVAERIAESLSRCLKWDSKGGKTKSVFLKTLDDRFVLKSLSPIETQAFLRFAPAYFQIMSESLFHDLPSVIAKMLGFYQIIIKNPVTGVEFNWFLLVMENLFYDRSPTRIFDLKGSMRNRHIQSTGEKNEVLLDENMVEFIYESPLFAREHSKKLLRASVWNDTLFLSKQNVMDYSLMVAIDEDKKELVVGIIDCIRTYTWDKKLEFWIKDRGKNKPTVTSPRDYKNRFREAMGRYVLQAPNCWHHFSAYQPDIAASRAEEQTDGREAEPEAHMSRVT